MNPPGNRSPSSPTARVAASIAATRTTLVFGLGDFQYYTGTCTALVASYDRLWGRVVPRMFHIAGPTHDWTALTNEQGYRRHFAGTCPGQRTGPSLLVRARRASVGPGDLWSRDVGTWHLVGLPTGLWRYSTSRARAMTRTLAVDLSRARARGKHLLVAYHDPYFTSTTDQHARDAQVRPWVDVLQRYQVRVTLSGSQHNYERTCPVLSTGACTPVAGSGTTAFNVSTGGIGLRPFVTTPRFIQRRFADTLRLAPARAASRRVVRLALPGGGRPEHRRGQPARAAARPLTAGGVPGPGQGRSKVTSRPSTAPGPIRPLTSTEVIALSVHPCAPCSLSTFSSLSPDIFPPIMPSRSSTTLYCGMASPSSGGPAILPQRDVVPAVFREALTAATQTPRPQAREIRASRRAGRVRPSA